MDPQLAMLLGGIKEQVENLAEDFHDEREQNRNERRVFLEKLNQQDLIVARVVALETRVESLKLQTMSNKTQLEKFVYADENQKNLDKHTMKIVAIFGSIFTGIVTCLWAVGGWIEQNWHVFSAFFKAKP